MYLLFKTLWFQETSLKASRGGLVSDQLHFLKNIEYEKKRI